MHPILFKIGSFQLPTYGVLLATALIVALYTVVRLGRREGLDTGRLVDFSTWIIVTALLGAKVLMILTEWTFYSQNPGQIFSLATLEAGGVFYGGFIAATVFAVWYVRNYKLPFWKVFDVYAPAIALGQSIGRLGCFSAGCDYGVPSNSFWAVTFSSEFSHQMTGVPLGVPLFPWQIVDSVTLLCLFGILIWRYKHKRRDGEIFLLYIVLYAVARFSLEFLRGDADRGFVFNHLLSTSQFIALLMLGLAAVLAYRWYGPGRKAGAVAGNVNAKARLHSK
ncbi:MAG TPA: prolipoprotein diacylglyceryl transferase [Terriglobia bacterium]|nr:prolipoprotein diacylglyceryl transferase [Terriglobia bacterium]